MKHIKYALIVAVMILLMIFTACSNQIQADTSSFKVDLPRSQSDSQNSIQDTSLENEVYEQLTYNGEVYIYGEEHGVVEILEKELALWSYYYENKGMRHLFVEIPYYTAELLNLWMLSDNNDIIDNIYIDSKGTLAHNLDVIAFYKDIKRLYPETIYHGTDIGHQYYTTGKRYLRYLEDNNLKDAVQYQTTQEAIEQGENYYINYDAVYRENKMTENFIRELEKLGSIDIMGIYGAAHIELDDLDYSIPSMANQLKEAYGEKIHLQNLSLYNKEKYPFRVDKITVGDKEYDASYFGKKNITGFKDFTYREFWRLEDAYYIFKDKAKTGDVLTFDYYPMLIETGQVFAVDYGKADGSVVRRYYRSDGNLWEGLISTEEFIE